VRRTELRIYVQPAGELDMATAPLLDQRLREERATGDGELVLDLRAVTFLDCSALRVVLGWTDALGAVIPGPANVHRMFELTGAASEVRFAEGPHTVPAFAPEAHRTAGAAA